MSDPPVDDLARRLGRLSSRQLALLRRRIDPGAPTADTAVPAPEEVPLLPSQEHMWSLAAAAPDAPFFTMFEGWRLQGPLDVDRLAAALDALEQRHDALRATFVPVGDSAVMRIGRPTGHLDVVDALDGRDALDDIAPDSAAAVRAALRMAVETAHQPFDLERGPLFRRILVRLGADDHALLIALHHLVADGWSVTVLQRELARADEAGPKGLGPAPGRLADHARALHERAARVRETEVRYWRAELAGPLPPIGLPPDRPGVWSSTTTERHAIVVGKAASSALAREAAAAHLTAFHVIGAALATVVSRWSGQRDIRFATHVAGRDRPELEEVVGLLMNTVIIRVDVDPRLPFVDLTHQVRDAMLRAAEHAVTPFATIVEAAGAAQAGWEDGPTPFLLHVVNLPLEPLALGQVAVRSLAPRGAFDLPMLTLLDAVIECRMGPLGLGGSVRYKPDRFDRSTIGRFVGDLQRTLAVAADGLGIELASLLRGPIHRV